MFSRTWRDPAATDRGPFLRFAAAYPPRERYCDAFAFVFGSLGFAGDFRGQRSLASVLLEAGFTDEAEYWLRRAAESKRIAYR